MIELDNLTVRFGQREILKGLTASVSGKTIGLLGPNGAGKTTLIHTLLGFHRPAAGTARILGHDIIRDLQAVRSLVGYMPENESFIPRLSAVRLLTLMAEISGIPAREALERAHQSLFYVGLGEARYRKLETFSQGMKQLVKLAQAIVHGPRVILLDEPTNALDPPARRRMLRLIREISETGKAHLIVSSHLLQDVETCCREVLILRDGCIVSHCDLEEESRGNPRLVEVETRGEPDSFIEAVEKLGCEWAQSGNYRFKMVLPDGVGAKQIYQVAQDTGVQLRRFSHRRNSLQDIFLRAME